MPQARPRSPAVDHVALRVRQGRRDRGRTMGGSSSSVTRAQVVVGWVVGHVGADRQRRSTRRRRDGVRAARPSRSPAAIASRARTGGDRQRHDPGIGPDGPEQRQLDLDRVLTDGARDGRRRTGGRDSTIAPARSASTGDVAERRPPRARVPRRDPVEPAGPVVRPEDDDRRTRPPTASRREEAPTGRGDDARVDEPGVRHEEPEDRPDRRLAARRKAGDRLARRSSTRAASAPARRDRTNRRRTVAGSRPRQRDRRSSGHRLTSPARDARTRATPPARPRSRPASARPQPGHVPSADRCDRTR